MINGCPPQGAVFKVEMIPATTTISWTNALVIGQTTNPIINIPVTIAGTQAIGNYLIRVVVYNPNGSFLEASANTKTITVARPTLTGQCAFATNGGGGSNTGGSRAPHTLSPPTTSFSTRTLPPTISPYKYPSTKTQPKSSSQMHKGA